MAIIDFHSHILPGIDDGSRSTAMSQTMLEAASAQGVEVICATPHFYADSMTIERFLRRRQEAYGKVLDCSNEFNIKIICGAEVAFFPGMSQADELEKLRFQNTDLMMVEMPFREWTQRDLREVELLLRRGIRPVIAHLERFYPFQKDKGVIPALLSMPVYVQINAECLLRWSTRGQPIKLFRNNQAHLLGSDCHNITSRPENLAEGRKVLEKKLGSHVLRQMDRLGTSLIGG